uniref:Uncharacterized protein n=1 Tax=Panagrolaimus davidi TaxID=227884 RepID=A0A914PRR8_9BILA
MTAANIECDLRNDESDTVLLSQFKLPDNCYRNKLNFYVDMNNFPFYQINKKIQNLPKYLNKMVKSKIPVIEFGHYLSVICIYDHIENEYDFSRKWNGIYGEELFISFFNEEYKHGHAAADDYLINPTYVVFGLLIIISMPICNIQTEKFWGFKIIKDLKNQVLIEFDNFDGKRNTASPAFFLAILLKEHRKTIQLETGKKSDEFGFWFLNEEKLERIKQGFGDAC